MKAKLGESEIGETRNRGGGKTDGPVVTRRLGRGYLEKSPEKMRFGTKISGKKRKINGF